MSLKNTVSQDTLHCDFHTFLLLLCFDFFYITSTFNNNFITSITYILKGNVATNMEYDIYVNRKLELEAS